MRSGDVKQARALAEELKRVTSSADLKSRADEILRYSNQP
jgi:hypothetical protein